MSAADGGESGTGAGGAALRVISAQNPRVKRVKALRDRRDRDRDGLFLVEGYRELLRAAEARAPVEEVLFCRDWFQGANEDELLERLAAGGARLVEVAKPIFAGLAYRDRPEGLLGICRQVRRGLDSLALGPAPLLVVAESIEKPGNLGTILRSADAAGADAVVVADAWTDLFNPNVVRASIGTLFTVPSVQVGSAEALTFLRARGIRVLAATPAAWRLYTDVPMAGPVALVVGSEQYGLTPLWLEAADERVRIPMRGRADSLNVATAATLLLFEAVRQRGPAGNA